MLSSITGNGWALIGAALAVILAGCGSAYGVGVAGLRKLVFVIN